MKNYLIILLFSFTTVLAGTLNIATAANVSYALPRLIKEFQKNNPQTKIQMTIGSSGKLTAQIMHGAPYDIFLSANMAYPKKLYEKGFALTKPVVYARGALALFSTKKRDFQQGTALVLDKNIRTIAIANPQTAPYGIAARQALQNASLYKKIKKKLVYGESVGQTVAYAVTAADLGFIAKSALFSPKMKQYEEGVNFKDVDPKLYTPIAQGIVLLKHATDNADAHSFYTFLLSQPAKEIFKAYGYSVQ
ncbi:molybdate ABC transporter substrate-binding protein [Sulfurimonas sp. NW9]|uniref:molybdate ABC transporter substrate-binding protein n=1 Tax=Sulfurimonas sp. NW9 TaxID=2922728 RepID=UPI003DA84AB2